MENKRMFKCVSLEGRLVIWQSEFTIGNEYQFCSGDSTHIKLFSDKGNALWVDKECFQEVTQDKPIKGYRLKYEKYYKAASMIIYGNNAGSTHLEDYIRDTYEINKLKRTGVLYLWFEPIYEEDRLEVGRWYKWKDSSIAYFQGVNIKTYGILFLSVNRWIESNNWFERCDNINNFTLATPKEVKEALIKEARVRGFKEGSRYKCAFDYKYNKNTDPLSFDKLYFSGRMLTDGCGGAIFYNGKWAEIISNELPEINGYKGKVVNGDYLKYGFSEIPLDWFNNGNSNRSIKSMTLDNGVTINEDQINQIREYLNENK